MQKPGSHSHKSHRWRKGSSPCWREAVASPGPISPRRRMASAPSGAFGRGECLLTDPERTMLLTRPNLPQPAANWSAPIWLAEQRQYALVACKLHSHTQKVCVYGRRLAQSDPSQLAISPWATHPCARQHPAPEEPIHRTTDRSATGRASGATAAGSGRVGAERQQAGPI